MEPDLIARLEDSEKRLSKGHKRIAEFVVTQFDKAAYMTAYRLGEEVGVSESTVVRFAVALGYDGYPELQKALQDMIRNRLTSVQRIEMSGDLREDMVLRSVLKTDLENIRKTLEREQEAEFRKAVSSLLKAKRIYVLGMRASAPLAQFFGYYLKIVCEDVVVPTLGSSDVLDEISRIGPDDLLFGISFPRYSSRTLTAMRFARERGATIIAMTDGEVSPLIEASDICLTAKSTMASFVDSLAAPLSLINALIVALGLMKKEAVSKQLKNLEDIWQTHQVYVGKT